MRICLQKATWMINGRSLKLTTRHEVQVEGTKHTLTINHAELKDQAEYSIQIADKTSTAQLFVEGKIIVFFDGVRGGGVI